MQINKKLKTTLMITLLTLSAIMVAIPMASANITTAPDLYEPGTTTPLITGPVGTELDVVGTTGSGNAAPFSTVTLYWGGLSGAELGSTTADAAGEWTVEDVEIPSAVTGPAYIVASDGSGQFGAEFTVTASVDTDVDRGLPGDEVVLTGHGFAKNDDITVTFDSTTLGTPVTVTLTSPAITTNGTGSFSATITIPSTIDVAEYDIYDVTAEDEASTTATTEITVDYYILLTPSSGPTGITTTMSGRIPASTAYTIKFNGATIDSGTSTSDGSFSEEYTIPGVLSPTDYDVEVFWETVNSRSAQFEVTDPPTIDVNPDHGMAGDVIVIDGEDFSNNAEITIYLGSTVVNSTALNEDFGPTDKSGEFADLEFTVPAISAGIYDIYVVDEYGASSTGDTFTVDATPVFSMSTRATEYVRMDFISLVSQSTSADDVWLVITDPSGLMWYYDAVDSSQWQDTGDYFELPYSTLALTWWPITSDAPLGTWNFTCYDSISLDEILDTNLFTVSAKPTMDSVLDRLDEIDEAITTSEGVIIDSIDGLDAKLTTISGNIATISTNVGDIQTTVSHLDITELTGDLATIQSDLGELTVAVSALDATVSSIEGDVATVKTNVGTLSGTISDIDGNTATIQTDVGAIKADITDVKSNVDNTPAWIAVVLALVAAIAAIFAVITIRQKIAG